MKFTGVIVAVLPGEEKDESNNAVKIFTAAFQIRGQIHGEKKKSNPGRLSLTCHAIRMFC